MDASVASISGYIPYGRFGLAGVTIPSGGVSTQTDSLGYYALTNIPTGTQTLLAAKDGQVFTTASRTVSLKANTALANYNFSLKSPNTAPTFAQPAKASVSSVTGIGSKITLTALGKDNSGEELLTYSWADTAGASLVVFGKANGTNAAKTIDATFLALGTYTLRCTLSDPYYTTVTSTVNVTVKPLQAGWATLSPFRATIAPGDSITFTATGWDQAGQSYQPLSVVWNTTSGKMNGTGILTDASLGPNTVGFNLSTERARVEVREP